MLWWLIQKIVLTMDGKHICYFTVSSLLTLEFLTHLVQPDDVSKESPQNDSQILVLFVLFLYLAVIYSWEGTLAIHLTSTNHGSFLLLCGLVVTGQLKQRYQIILRIGIPTVLITSLIVSLLTGLFIVAFYISEVCHSLQPLMVV